MSYEVLALKWRPKKFQDLVGQEHVFKSLQHSIKSQTIAHSYLFTGTRGVGKTSLARIFSKAINCLNLSAEGEPCLECSSCQSVSSDSSLNYLEIDGASHNGVEHVRNLIDSLQYLPTQGKYRVAVIDEVHMLSTNAFNALLKTLEEPPAHVIFIFATTNPEKIPDTVMSRCQRFDLKSLSKESLQKIITDISNAEGIKFDEDSVIDMIAQLGKGSVRDTLTLLEQLKSFTQGKVIKADDLAMSLGLARTDSIEKVVNSIIKSDLDVLTNSLTSVFSENIDLKLFCEQVLKKIFDYTQIALKRKPQSFEVLASLHLNLSKEFDWILKSIDPESLLKLCFQKYAFSHLSEEKKTQIPVKEPFKFKMEAFINYLKKVKPASAANLELGNLLKDEESDEEFILSIAFPQKSAVIYDFFQEKDVKESLEKILSDFLKENEVTKATKINFTLFEEKDNFKSIMDVKVEQEQKAESEIIENFMNSDMVKQTEKIFGKSLSDVKIRK